MTPHTESSSNMLEVLSEAILSFAIAQAAICNSLLLAAQLLRACESIAGRKQEVGERARCLILTYMRRNTNLGLFGH